MIEKTEEPRIRLFIEFYFHYRLPNWFDRWDPDDNVPISFVEDVTFLNQVGEERLGELSYKMLDVVTQWFPITQVSYPEPFTVMDTQTITMTPRVELVYSRQAEAQFAVSKISTQVYHDVFLPRAWDGEMEHTAGSERDFMGGQIEKKFDQAAGNIAGALEQLAVIAEQEQTN